MSFDPEKGGAHLGVVRSWIQRRARNGDWATWGSNEFLELNNVTVSEMEHLACDIARAVVGSFITTGDIDEAWRNADKPPVHIDAERPLSFKVWVGDDGKVGEYLTIGTALNSLYGRLKK